MRLAHSSIIAAVFLSLVFADSSEEQVNGNAVYFLRDDSHRQWCAYASESRFKEQIQPLRALVVGAANYANGRLLALHLTQTDETGDWAVNDEYTCDKSGKIETLRRTINILPEDSSEEQLFVIHNGRALKQSSVHRELRSGKASQRSVNWFKAPPVMTDIEAFPFSALIGSRRGDVWSGGSVCVP
jgi:hypothetical protein